MVPTSTGSAVCLSWVQEQIFIPNRECPPNEREQTYSSLGLVTWALIDALFNGDTNGGGLIELSELAAHVENTVPKISAEMNGRGAAEILMQLLTEGHRQTAHFGSTGGDFALVRRLQ